MKDEGVSGKKLQNRTEKSIDNKVGRELKMINASLSEDEDGKVRL